MQWTLSPTGHGASPCCSLLQLHGTTASLVPFGAYCQCCLSDVACSPSPRLPHLPHDPQLEAGTGAEIVMTISKESMFFIDKSSRWFQSSAQSSVAKTCVSHIRMCICAQVLGRCCAADHAVRHHGHSDQAQGSQLPHHPGGCAPALGQGRPPGESLQHACIMFPVSHCTRMQC